jgi:uncharacterized membrane protein
MKMKSNTKHTVFSLALSAALALGAAACGPSVPAKPDWQFDVLPILQARCNRCHNATIGRADPAIKQTGSTPRTAIGDFTNQTSATALGTSIISDVTSKKMPPLPAAPLDDWEIQVLKNFFKK